MTSEYFLRLISLNYAMKNPFIKLLFLLFFVNLSHSQEWLTNLEVAKSLAFVQNKMVLMVWEETTKYPYAVVVNDDKGRTLIIENLFEDENLSPLIWKNFIPVIVSEYKYADLHSEIKGKRSQKYIDKFNDDSIKIMDVNGHILNLSDRFEGLQNVSTIIQNYALNTEFVAVELSGYRQEQNFYTSFYLASKYLDYAMYMNKEIRPELIELANIYLDEASLLIEKNPAEDQPKLSERVELLKIQQALLIKRPKKVIRQLKRLGTENISVSNQPIVAFLYYTAYRILKNETKASLWESKISSVNLRKSKLIINLNS